MLYHQISLTNRRAEQLFLLRCTPSVRLQLSCDLSASRIPEAPGPLPDAWVGAVPSTVVFCRNLGCWSRGLLWPVDHSPECSDHCRDPWYLLSVPALSQISFDFIGTWLLPNYSFLCSGCCLTFFAFIWIHDRRKLQIPPPWHALQHIHSQMCVIVHSGGQKKSQGASK